MNKHLHDHSRLVWVDNFVGFISICGRAPHLHLKNKNWKISTGLVLLKKVYMQSSSVHHHEDHSFCGILWWQRQTVGRFFITWDRKSENPFKGKRMRAWHPISPVQLDDNMQPELQWSRLYQSTLVCLYGQVQVQKYILLRICEKTPSLSELELCCKEEGAKRSSIKLSLWGLNTNTGQTCKHFGKNIYLSCLCTKYNFVHPK